MARPTLAMFYACVNNQFIYTLIFRTVANLRGEEGPASHGQSDVSAHGVAYTYE